MASYKGLKRFCYFGPHLLIVSVSGSGARTQESMLLTRFPDILMDFKVEETLF